MSFCMCFTDLKCDNRERFISGCNLHLLCIIGATVTLDNVEV